MKAAVVKKISNDDSVNWKEYPLEEVLDVIRGISFKSTEKLSEKGVDSVACLRTANVQADVDWDDLWWVPESFVKRDEQFVRQNDILMSNANSYELVGKVSLVKSVPTKSTLGAFITLLRSREGFDPKFFFYQLRSARLVNEIRSRASTTTNISNVSTGKLRDIPLFCPSLEKQQKIVAKIEELFSHIDAGIDALKQSKQLLKQYRQSVLKAAVTGELSKEWREQNKDKLEPASKLLERILQERRQKWEAQQLEQFKAKGKLPKDEGWKDKYEDPKNYANNDLKIPESWILARAEQICEFITKGATPAKENLNQGNGEIPFIKVYNLRFDTTLDFTIDPTFTDSETHNLFLARSRVYPGDVLMNIVGPPLGKVSIVPDLHREWNINQAVAAYRPINGITNKMLSYFLLSKPVLNWMLKRTKTTAGQVNLTLEIVRDVPIPIMSEAEQVEIVRLVEAKLTSIDQVENSIDSELQRSERLKQSVLQSAFGGLLT